VTFELVADGRPDQIGPVRIESFLHHQIDLTEVDIAMIFSVSGVFGRSSRTLSAITASTFTSNGMVYGCHVDVRRVLSRGRPESWYEQLVRCGAPILRIPG
jgi:hypothetical protein